MGNVFKIRTCFLYWLIILHCIQIAKAQDDQQYHGAILKENNLSVLEAAMDSLDSIHPILASQGEFYKAARARQAYNNAAFRYRNLSDSLKIEELKETYRLDIQASEIKLGEAHLANQRQIIFISLGIGLLFLLAIIFIRRNIRQKTIREAEMFKIKQLRKAAEDQLKIAQEQHLKAEKARLQEVIELKNQRLSGQMLELINQNQLLTEIQEKIDQWKDSPQLQSEIQAELQKQLNPEEAWQSFLRQFETVYPDFFAQLRSLAPQLTDNDLKLCALLRLQLSSKEMASLLGLSADSVKTARYRLKQKLNLDKDQKLTDYLMHAG